MHEAQERPKVYCAGCGAKIGASVLDGLLEEFPVLEDQNLLVGFQTKDDACVYQISPDTAVIQTLDFFPPLVEDPYLFGKIAATNAISDIYAMGGVPKLALNIFTMGKKEDPSLAKEIMRGGYEVALAHSIHLAGGHSIYDDPPKYGLSVTGFVHPQKIWRNMGLQTGDLLFMTKALGIGINMLARQCGELSEEAYTETLNAVLRSNAGAAGVLRMLQEEGSSPHAVTDVTGFGFLGHLSEMAQDAAKKSYQIVLYGSRIPLLPQVLELASQGIMPEAVYKNRQAFVQKFSAEDLASLGTNEAFLDVLFDPQTSGGLLFALPARNKEQVLEAMAKAGETCYCVGEVLAADEGERRSPVIRLCE